MAKSVEELLKECIERLNAIDANAKKIDELPHQLALQTLSKLHVSNQGTSEYLEVQQIVDAVTALTYDRIVSIGTIVLSGNTVTIPANAQWVIANINYSNVLPIALNSPFAATGLARKDIIVANKFNSMTLIRGTETAGITIRPNIPIDTVLVTEMDVTDSNIGNILPPNTSVNGVVTTRMNYNGTGVTDFKGYVDNLPPFTVAVNEILYFEDSESNDIVLFLQRGGTYGQGYPGISVRGYLKFTGGGSTQLRKETQIYTSGAQEFTLPEAAAQIVLITVNGGAVYDYTILSDTLVRIDLPLVPTVRVVIHYLVDLNLGTVPYYTQAQVDAMLPVGSNKTKGSVTATDDPGNDAILEFDLNEVYKPNDGYTVVLPTTTEIGKEIYVFALNNNGGFDVLANQNADNKLSGINGIDGVIDVVVVKPNQSYRFIHRQNGYWYYELLESNVKNLQAVMDNGRTYGSNIYGVSCNLRFFTTADGNVFSELSVDNGVIKNEITFGTLEVALKSGTTKLYLRNEDFKIEKKQTTIGIDDSETSIVTAINFPAKTIAGDYKVVVQPSSTYTVATLPAGVLGDIAIVTDASSPTYAATVVGGGAVTIKVWYNGTNWVCN